MCTAFFSLVSLIRLEAFSVEVFKISTNLAFMAEIEINIQDKRVGFGCLKVVFDLPAYFE